MLEKYFSNGYIKDHCLPVEIKSKNPFDIGVEYVSAGSYFMGLMYYSKHIEKYFKDKYKISLSDFEGFKKYIEKYPGEALNICNDIGNTFLSIGDAFFLYKELEKAFNFYLLATNFMNWDTSNKYSSICKAILENNTDDFSKVHVDEVKRMAWIIGHLACCSNNIQLCSDEVLYKNTKHLQQYLRIATQYQIDLDKLDKNFVDEYVEFGLRNILNNIVLDNSREGIVSFSKILIENLIDLYKTAHFMWDSLEKKESFQVQEKKNVDKNSKLEEKSVIEKSVELINKGIIAKRKGDFKRALDYYVAAVKLVPTNGNTYYAMGKLLYINGKYEEAMKAYYLAYVHEANVLTKDLYRHYGHSFIDGNDNLKSSNLMNIEAYKKTISGISSSLNLTYEKYCEDIGKKELNKRIKLEREK